MKLDAAGPPDDPADAPSSQPQVSSTGLAEPASGLLNVWIVNQYALKFPGPGGTRHHYLAKVMAGEGIATTIVAQKANPGGGPPADIAIEDHDDAMFVWVPTRPYSGNGLGRVLNMLGFARAVIRLGWSPRRHGLPRPDVVVGSSPQPFAAMAAWLVARRQRVPFIFEVRDLWPESLIAILGVPRYHPLVLVLGAIEKFLYTRSDRIVGLIGGLEDHVAMRVGRNAPPVIWIPNGVEIDLVPEPRPVIVPGDEFRVLYVGAHGPPNSLGTVLEAAAVLEADAQAGLGPRVRFDLYGDGASKHELVQQATREGLRSVHFHAPVPKSEVYRLLDASDATILLLPRLYLWRFGISPNKLFDYLAAARPVVLAVDSPGDPVTVASAGVKVRPEEPQDLAAKIRELVALPLEDRQAMGARGRAYVAANHDMSVLGRRFAAVVRDSIGR